MNIKALVDRGLYLREQIAVLEKELAGIEAALKAIGLNSGQEDLKDAEREGKRWLAHGTKLAVPVIFTADKIVGSFQMNSPKHSQLKVLAGEELKVFYKLTQKFENEFESGKKFRQMAAEVLGARGPAFVTACVARDKDGLPKSDIKVCWEENEPVI